MSALPMCNLIQQQVGMETILHFTTRDRSLMGLQSDLLGAHALGVRNILALRVIRPRLEPILVHRGYSMLIPSAWLR